MADVTKFKGIFYFLSLQVSLCKVRHKIPQKLNQRQAFILVLLDKVHLIKLLVKASQPLNHRLPGFIVILSHFFFELVCILANPSCKGLTIGKLGKCHNLFENLSCFFYR